MTTNDKVLVPRELLPCPFCGSPAEIDTGGFGEILAACTKCWCHMGAAWSTSEDSAVAAWNRRAAAPQPAEEAVRVPRDDQVICPECCHQFRAIPVQVQGLLLAAGYMPPFAAPAVQPAEGVKLEGTRHPDDVAVDLFAAAMKAKLEYARNRRGRSGWDDKSDCTAEHLSNLLRGHVEKGDPTDVANFCCFLWNRQEAITQPRSAQVVVPLEQMTRDAENDIWQIGSRMANLCWNVSSSYKADGQFTFPVDYRKSADELRLAWESANKKRAATLSQPQVVVDEAARDTIDSILHKLTDWSRAYPLDIFPEPTDEQVTAVNGVYPSAVTRISASMGRHMVALIEKDLAALTAALSREEG